MSGCARRASRRRPQGATTLPPERWAGHRESSDPVWTSGWILMPLKLKITGFECHIDDELCSRKLSRGLAVVRLGRRLEWAGGPRQHQGDLHDAQIPVGFVVGP